LRGLASIITADEILKFIDDVENDRALCLQGGDAVMHVAKDQNPEKMDLELIAKADVAPKTLSPEQRNYHIIFSPNLSS
jgi:hypothetical protein